MGYNQGNNNAKYRHGLSKHRIHKIWTSMMTRCYNHNSIAYKKYYGSEGIKVCERWHDFINFYNDTIDTYKEGLTLDRFPNTKGDYEPENVRWVSPKQQARNISCNIIIEHNSEKMCLGELSEKLNIAYSFLYYRIVMLKWDVDKAINTPHRYSKYKNKHYAITPSSQ